jgi:cyclopropane-fatty-acyl-phospholipid synthase
MNYSEAVGRFSFPVDAERQDIPCLAPHDREVILRAMNKNGLLEVGERYIEGDWNATKIDDVVYYLLQNTKQPSLGKLIPHLARYAARERIMNPQRGRGIFTIAQRHYDLGNDLFSIMLDTSMTYTSGYWKEADSLKEAQSAKLDLLCRKLKIEPGMRVLDIGCGWGNFAEHAARYYGAEVTGVTVSKEQAYFAQSRCKELSVDILLQDYEEVSGCYDRIVSIEMIEAVGRQNLHNYYRTVSRLLAPDGLFALQAISAETFTANSNRHLDSYVLWILKYIFPNGYLPNSSELVAATKHGLHLHDWHTLSGDYERTLLAWAENFEKGWRALQEKYGERFYRVWRYYLYGCAALFRAQLVNVHQVVYAKSDFRKRYEAER